MASIPTGVLLVQRGVATQHQVDLAWRDAKALNERLCSRLLEMGIPEERLAAVLAEKHGVPGVDLSRCIVDLSLLALVPRLVAEADHILPLSDEGGRLHLAMATPHDERVLTEVRFVTGREVSPYVCVRGAAHAAIRAAYDAREAGELTWRGKAAGPGLPPVVAVALPPGTPGDAEPVELGADELVLAEVAPIEVEPLEAAPLEAAPIEAVPLEPEEGGLLDAPLLEPVSEVEIPLEVEGDEPLGPGPAAAGADEVVLTVRAQGRRTVLVVDDEPEIRLLVQRALERHGYAVETAADGAEGLAKCEALVPDLVLLDAMLPKVHGFEACRRIKSSPKTRGVPVVMMTAVYRGWRFAEDARDTYGAEDYIEKPFRIDDMLRRIELVLEATSTRQGHPAGAAEPHLAQGRELLTAHQLPEAQAAFEAAIQADPYSAEAHAQLARTLRARGDAYSAMTEFERAAELRPGYLPALRALAALYEEKGFRRKATETLERALSAATDPATHELIKEDLMALLG